MSNQLRYAKDNKTGGHNEDDDQDNGLFTNRSVMMANFEEWIKMATDNKINSRNSWNFALIDYFHDLNVLRDSENNINFQKASATLDGCIKIYSSRVDSVTNETGKLLSGLAQKKQDKNKNTSKNNENSEEDDDENEDSVQIDPITGLPVSKIDDNEEAARRRNYNRVLETTLVEFDSIKMKELDQELNIDPLFKKALVDFDEGGAKSLLLNTLNIDESGRVVFDASMKDITSINDNKDKEEDKNEDEIMSDVDNSSEIDNVHETPENSRISQGSGPFDGSNVSIDDDASITIEDEILELGMDFINFAKISESEISPSIQQLRSVVEDVNKEKSFIDNINNNMDNFLTEQELADVTSGDNDNNNNISKNDIPPMDMGGIPDLEYSAGGLSNVMDNDNHDYDDNDDDVNSFNGHNINDINQDFEDSKLPEASDTTTGSIFEQDLMAYFDETLKRNWRGREHWKVRSIKKNLLQEKDVNSPGNVDNDNKITSANTLNYDGKNIEANQENSTDQKVVNKSKQRRKQTEIDFFNIDADDAIEEKIFSSKSKASIELAQKFRTNDTHYLLPDDYHFTSEKIVHLCIKPEQKMSLFNYKRRKNNQFLKSSSYYNDSNMISNTSRTHIQSKNGPELADEAFWAENYERKEKEDNDDQEGGDVRGMEVENPFDDEGDGIDFNQAFDENGDYDDDADQNSTDNIIPKTEQSPNGDHKPIIKDNKVNYSRVSKKVDVKRLKNNVWKSINTLVSSSVTENDTEAGDSVNQNIVDTEPIAVITKQKDPEKITLKFTDIAKEITKAYSPETMKDISTSFSFICLLHLANEHGLHVKSSQNFEDLIVDIDLKCLPNIAR